VTDWLATLKRLERDATDGVLVTIAAAKGSTPRGPGTRMVITAEAIHGTIGGGHLEFKAIEVARARLGSAGCELRRFPLGPALGQCCGGHATLLFETLPRSEDPAAWRPVMAALEDLREPAVQVTLAKAAETSRKMLVGPDLCVGSLGGRALDAEAAAEARALLHGEASRSLLTQNDDTSMFYDVVLPSNFNIVIFGAGHVGRALVDVLAGLPCRITWIDDRDDGFPAKLPENASAEVSPDPVYDVDEAPAGSFFLVLTHSHHLDLRLTERILRRGDFRYFGLIGSKTKRQRFEARLRKQGIAEPTLARMACPIGISGISGKHPAEIAVSVAAELLRQREAGNAMARERGERIRSA
jgi:xanthine dehydrogenase accessory factor